MKEESPTPPEGFIAFGYYNDLEKASQFYRDKMGFKLVIDLDFAKVYQAYESVHIGLVDGKRGYLRVSQEKPVMLTFFVRDIESWHRDLLEKGVPIEQEPKEASYLKMKTMLFRDPEGYLIELLQWLSFPYGQA